MYGNYILQRSVRQRRATQLSAGPRGAGPRRSGQAFNRTRRRASVPRGSATLPRLVAAVRNKHISASRRDATHKIHRRRATHAVPRRCRRASSLCGSVGCVWLTGRKAGLHVNSPQHPSGQTCRYLASNFGVNSLQLQIYFLATVNERVNPVNGRPTCTFVIYINLMHCV